MSAPNLNTFAPKVKTGRVSEFLSLPEKGSKIVVIGSGAFGVWTALFLQQYFKVTLIDAWGPGNARSSSGDETRVIRSTYGNNEFYFDLNVRSLSLWKDFEQKCHQQLFFNKGVLWLCHEENSPLVDDSIPFTKKHGMEYEYISTSELAQNFPTIQSRDLHHAWYDPYGGYLKARESCALVTEMLVKSGGSYVNARVRPGDIHKGKIKNLSLSNSETITADYYIFACGAWMGKLFPDVLGNIITCSRQEVYYFGVPAEMARQFDQLPVWVDVDGQDFYYGIPGNGGMGFKVGVDRRGDPFDPSSDDRIICPKVLAHARTFLAHRFPALAKAPLVENRVCPYENSPDGNFIFDRHPEAENIAFLGGGSGHGFKHGPALGELVANVLSGKSERPWILSLDRFMA